MGGGQAGRGGDGLTLHPIDADPEGAGIEMGNHGIADQPAPNGGGEEGVEAGGSGPPFAHQVIELALPALGGAEDAHRHGAADPGALGLLQVVGAGGFAQQWLRGHHKHQSVQRGT
jgi:hypothetical protein